MIDVGKYNIHDLYQHALMIRDDGLIEAKEFERTSDGYFSVIVYRLTSKGYDFLEINNNQRKGISKNSLKRSKNMRS